MVLCCIFFLFSFKDWICNKIEHCDVGMIFHSTLEPRFHLEEKKTKWKTIVKEETTKYYHQSGIDSLVYHH